MRPRSTLLLPAFGALLAAAAPGQAIVPEPLRDPRIAAFRFPESEATLTRWVTEQARGITAETRTAAAAALALHGWGLWTALTADTAQFSDGQRPKVFETWVTPDDLLPSSDPVARSALARPERLAAGHRSTLQPLRQFSRRPAEDEPPDEPAPESAIDRITGFTKFNPTAAARLAAQRLLERATPGQFLAELYDATAGFVVGANASRTILISAVGPTVGAFGVADTMGDPKFERFSDSASKDAMLLVTLPPGAYTAQVSGANNTSGAALVEIYEVP